MLCTISYDVQVSIERVLVSNKCIDRIILRFKSIRLIVYFVLISLKKKKNLETRQT